MKVGSLFTGIGGFDKGFEDAGMTTVWQVEREPFCLAVLKTRFPSAKRFDDVRTVGRSNLEPVDLIAAGVPCQDVSVAGKRAGLAGERTGLFYEFARILQELRPAWFVFENVPGLFSSNNGRDFAEVLRVLMVECGYGVCWRVLNSQYFGVAQRRRRVFIVGRFGEPCPAEVLFEPESGRRDFATSEETWERTPESIAASLGGSGRSGGFMPNAEQSAGNHLIVNQAISSKWAKGTSRPAGDEHHNLVPALTSNGYQHKGFRDEKGLVAFDTTQITSKGNYSNPKPGDPCHPLAAGAHPPAIANTLRSADGHHGRSSPRGDGGDNLVCGAIDRFSGGPDDNAAQQGHIVTGTLRAGAGAPKHASDEKSLICSAPYPNRVRGFASLPEGLDSARYRALGNAVTASVAHWIGKRIVEIERTRIFERARY